MFQLSDLMVAVVAPEIVGSLLFAAAAAVYMATGSAERRERARQVMSILRGGPTRHE
jgi:hypothetical protein